MIAVATADDAIGSRYVEEILSQAGLPWESRDAAFLEVGGRPAVIVLAGDGRLDAPSRAWLEGIVHDGAGLVVTGGTWGLDDLLGVAATGDDIAFITGRDAAHPITRGLESSLHVFHGQAVRATSGTAIARGVITHRPGHGATVAIGANLPASVLHIQLGRAIHEDGDPAPDGTAPIDEGILKTDDGIVLDWTADRIRSAPPALVPDCPGKDPAYPDGDTPWFGLPVADELRALLLNAIHWAAAETGQMLPLLAPWPRQIPAVGLISHDSDGNLDAGAHSTLAVLAEAGIHSTWCHMWGPDFPSQYDPATFGRIHDAGHEFALHYNAVTHDGGTWGRDHFARQAAYVRNEGGVDGFVSNKNHYLRWEGKLDFFHWLVDEGIQADQCKGPSKKGNVGYPHGSGLPWFPLDPDTGETIDVLEIPLQFQDLWLTAPAYLNAHTITQAVRHHGVAHFLYHQVHIHTKPDVVTALLHTVAVGRANGLEWWTSAEINDWQRLRRLITVRQEDDRLLVTSPVAVPGATFVVTLPTGTTGNTTWANQPAISLTADLTPGENVLVVPKG